MKKLFFIFAALFIVVSCNGSKEKAATPSDLKGKRFMLVSFNDKPIDSSSIDNTERKPFLAFDKDMGIFGVICNNFNGSSTVENGVITAQAASTMMLCGDDVINEAENYFYNALYKGAKININADKLMIHGDNSTFVFKQDK